MTKIEKQLIAKIDEIKIRKHIEGNAVDMYTVKKLSNNNYECEIIIGNKMFQAKGKDSKIAIKNAIAIIK